MTRRLLLIGEGPRDIGEPDLGLDLKRKVPCDFEGDLPRLVRRLVRDHGGPDRFGYDAITIREVVSQIPRVGRATRSGGKSKDLRDAVVAQVRSGHPLGVVALIDARLDEVSALRQDVGSILAECAGTPVVIGLAIQEIEVWMLADERARIAAFSPRVGARPIVERLESVDDPKTLWSDRAGQLPAAAGIPSALHQDQQRAAAWAEMSLDVAAQRCPDGFGRFRAAFRDFVGQVFPR